MENKKGTTWTDREVEYLKELFDRGLSDYEIGEKLGRSQEGIKSKRQMIGLSRTAYEYNSTWTDEEKQLLLDNYMSMSVDELADLLNKKPGSIRYMKTRMHLHKRNHPRSDSELDIIREYYELHEGLSINLIELSELLGRTPQIISRWAKEMGYTDQYRPYYTNREMDISKHHSRSKNPLVIEAVKEALAKVDKTSDNFNSEFQKALWQTDYYRNVMAPRLREKISEIWKIKGHPRGMLGKHHTKEVRDLMSCIVKERYANMTEEEKHKIAMKGIATKIKNGTFMNTTSNAYSRTKSGKRPDLGNQFFRSAWEANVARILNYLQIKWEYESKRFYFEEAVDGVLSYQPDFYLPEFDMWIEVKGWMDEKSKIRLKLFAEQYPNENKNLILIDQDKYKEFEKDFCWLENWEGKKKKFKTIEKEKTNE